MAEQEQKEDIQTIELFIGCEDLVNASQKTYDSFCVVMIRRDESSDFEELQRTETICRKAHPQYCTSIEVDHNSKPSFSPILRFDIYERKTVDTERLRDHTHRGMARASVSDLLHSRGNQLTLLLHHPRVPKDAGTVFIATERVDRSNNENESVVQIDVAVSVLRKRDWNKILMSQRYELCRAHQHEDEHGQTVWLPVYRSDRIARQRDSGTWIEFTTASIKYRQLCNADEERDMRLVVYGMPHVAGTTVMSGGVAGVAATVGVIKKTETLIAYADFTLRFVCEIDPTEEVLALERNGGEEIGNVSILKAEPTDFGSYFSLRVNYEHTGKYTSAASEEKKGGVIVKKLRIAKLVKKMPLVSSGKAEPKMLANISVVNGLFSADSLASDDHNDDDTEGPGESSSPQHTKGLFF